LGIGATTAIFSLVDATLLEPLPYPQPEQLVSIQGNFPGIGAQDVGFSEPEWRDLQHSGIFEYVSPTWFDENNLTGSSQPARVRLLIVAPNYFALLGWNRNSVALSIRMITRLGSFLKSSSAMGSGSARSGAIQIF
jgi:putative ABC transport system permease protein